VSAAVHDENIARIVRVLEEEQRRKLYGTVTVFFQNGVIERVETKRTAKIGDLPK
jgi:hypothetical protein